NLFFAFGDWYLTRRLRDWAAHSEVSPALLVRPEPEGFFDHTACSYQLTPLGKRLRDHGLESPTQAPPMVLGGCQVYGHRPTWVRRSRGRQWWIERWDG